MKSPQIPIGKVFDEDSHLNKNTTEDHLSGSCFYTKLQSIDFEETCAKDGQ